MTRPKLNPPGLHPTLARVVALLADARARHGLTRYRGNFTRGGGFHEVAGAWAEISGYGPDGSRRHLKLRYRVAEDDIRAGLLVYPPAMRGGSVVLAGEAGYPADQADHLVQDIIDWLEKLEE